MPKFHSHPTHRTPCSHRRSTRRTRKNRKHRTRRHRGGRGAFTTGASQSLAQSSPAPF